MTRREDDAVRFAVGTPDGPHSSVYRLWVGSDSSVYIAARTIAGDVKVSLHAHGPWRYGFTSKHIAGVSPFVADGTDRAKLKWSPPAESGPGCTRAFTVIVPGSELRPRSGPMPPGKPIHWTPAPSQDEAVHFTVWLSIPEATEATSPGWPARRGMGTQLVGKLPMPDGRTCWLTSVVFPATEEQRIEFEAKRALGLEALRLAGREDGADIRMELFGEDDQGSKVFVDLAISDSGEPVPGSTEVAEWPGTPPTEPESCC